MKIKSFGFKKSGIPSDSTMVFDVRNLRNPHDDITLREKNGKNIEVIQYVLQDETFTNVMTSIITSIEIAKRDNMVVSIGCTGGKHRSVVMADMVAQYFGISAEHVEL